jgi:type II pantothenate kinase
MPPSPAVLGVDVGATLAKLAFRGEALHTEHMPSGDLDGVRARIIELAPRRIVATGGGADALGDALGGVVVEHLPEFEAWSRGAPRVAADEGLTLPPCYLVVSLGTGTSVLAIRDGSATRVGGTGLGGGTILGLGRLLLGAGTFTEIADLASRGQRSAVDLVVSDIYRGPSPLPGDLTAANFAKLGSTKLPDLAHALLGLVGENVALVSAGLARLAGANVVLYGGSTLSDNPALRGVLERTTALAGLTARFLTRGAYCGAVGAALLGCEQG